MIAGNMRLWMSRSPDGAGPLPALFRDAEANSA